MHFCVCFVVLEEEIDKANFKANDTGGCSTSCGGGGWWMNTCDIDSCLNGLYFHDDFTDARAGGMPNGIFYKSFHQSAYYSLKKTTMMMRETIDWPK